MLRTTNKPPVPEPHNLERLVQPFIINLKAALEVELTLWHTLSTCDIYKRTDFPILKKDCKSSKVNRKE